MDVKTIRNKLKSWLQVTISFFLCLKVASLFRARLIGLPSGPAEGGYLSTSSQNRNRIALRERFAGEPAT